MAKPATPSRFDYKLPAGQRAAFRQGERLVVKHGSETRAAFRATISRAISEATPPIEAARAIIAMIGLDRRRAMAAMNYRAGLFDQRLPLARVDMLTDRFVRKKLRERAVAVARTETISALSKGLRQSWRQAENEGLISEDERRERVDQLRRHLRARAERSARR